MGDIRMRFAVLLALSVLLPALRKPEGDKPATPAEQYQALVKEHMQAMREYRKAYGEAKTIEERNKMGAPQLDRFTSRFLELARKHPRDPAAFDSLVWIIRTTFLDVGLTTPARKDAAEAAEILRSNYVSDSRMAQLCRSLPLVTRPETEKILQAVLEKNPDRELQGIACFVLAQYRQMEALRAEGNAADGTADKLRQEAGRYFDRLEREYVDVGSIRGMVLASQSLPVPAALIRTVLEKTPEREAKGKGYYILGQRLKGDSERAAQHGKVRAAEQLSREAEQVWERVVKDYADVALGRARNHLKLGDLVKNDLYELRHLGIGKQAPEIEGEDIDGKKFKLSDYRGKVVLLDFWGHW
jgi:hypothetical protein